MVYGLGRKKTASLNIIQNGLSKVKYKKKRIVHQRKCYLY